MRASMNAGMTRDELSGARIDRDTFRLFPRTPLRWTPGRFFSLTVRRDIQSTQVEKEIFKRRISTIAQQLQALPPVAKLVEIFLKLTLASRSVILYARGRDIPRVPN